MATGSDKDKTWSMGHVFVSYSWADTQYVDELVAYLSAAGVNVWIDRDEIQVGARVRRTILTQSMTAKPSFSS